MLGVGDILNSIKPLFAVIRIAEYFKMVPAINHTCGFFLGYLTLTPLT